MNNGDTALRGFDPYAKATAELTKWEDLMLDSLEGKCVFTPEQIKSRMESVRERTEGLIENIKKLQEQSSEAEAIASDLMNQHQRLLSWAEMFDSASPQEKK